MASLRASAIWWSRSLHTGPFKPFRSKFLNPTGAAFNSVAMNSAQQLDTERFSRLLDVTAVKVPNQRCQKMVKSLAPHLLRKPKVKPIVNSGDEEHKLVYIGCDIENLHSLSVNGVQLDQYLSDENLDYTKHQIRIGYEQMNVGEVLAALLPPEITELPSAFETIGHIAHLNLREDLLPWRHIIGKVLLDKNPKLKTVVNKTGAIENEWRVLPMEVIAGDDTTVTQLRQGGALFTLDFATVYWNSRLESEHVRLVDTYFKAGETVLDAMAGIGPFAIPAALKGCSVIANDLNPESFRWLKENVVLNKVDAKVQCYNLDGREIIRLAAGGSLPPVPAEPLAKTTNDSPSSSSNEPTQGPAIFHHVIMNLPATAITFLDACSGSFCRRLWAGKSLPLIHVYGFLAKDESTEALQKRAETALGGLIESPVYHLVRDVSPNKAMYCMTFRLPENIAFKSHKRQKVESSS